LRTGLQVDLRIVEKNEFGAALLYFTGSKEHSVELRKIGQEKDLKVNEYGVFSGKKKLASKTEEKMYKALGLRYIEPELREDKGEFEASRNNNLPKLVELDDIKGDLQTHTKASDGKYSLKEMVEGAQDLGYEYYAVTDHSKKVTMANGLDEKRLTKQIEEIDKLNKKMKQIKILKSIEVDILEDGSLDLSDDILKELDIVICSIHYNMNLSKKKQTRRVLKAMENPHFNILAHPTGRMINKRSPYDIDLEDVMKEAKDKGCFLEINANPDRLDLNDDHARLAKEIGLKLSISTDAHSTDNLHFMKYGVAQARRGWLEKDDVLNTRSWEDLKKLLKR
jgi:DNA polymerase (family 10)